MSTFFFLFYVCWYVCNNISLVSNSNPNSLPDSLAVPLRDFFFSVCSLSSFIIHVEARYLFCVERSNNLQEIIVNAAIHFWTRAQTIKRDTGAINILINNALDAKEIYVNELKISVNL